MTERDNSRWVLDLKEKGKKRTEALRDLRAELLRGLPAALASWVRQDSREFLSLCEDFVQEALLLILQNLEAFQGLSRFTTWAHKICIRVALSELRKARWKDFSLDNSSEIFESEGEDLEQKMMLSWLKKMIQEELTPLQQRALTAAFQGVSGDVVAQKLGISRGALYKLLYDARCKLKKLFDQTSVGRNVP